MKVILTKDWRIKTKFCDADFDKIALEKGLIIEPNDINEYTLDIFGVIYTYSLEQILLLKDDVGDLLLTGDNINNIYN